METLVVVLPIIKELLLIGLLITLLVLSIKIIITIDTFNKMFVDLKEKLSVFNNIITAYKLTANKMRSISSGMVDIVINIINKLLNKDEGDDNYV